MGVVIQEERGQLLWGSSSKHSLFAWWPLLGNTQLMLTVPATGRSALKAMWEKTSLKEGGWGSLKAKAKLETGPQPEGSALVSFMG